MTVSADRPSRKDYVASAGQTTFPYDFQVYASTDLLVYQNNVLINTYTVSGVGDVAGGNVILATGATAGDTVSIVCSMPISQGVDYVELDSFPAETHERALDKLTIIAQQQDEQIGRSIKFPAYSGYTGGVLPDPVVGKLLAWSGTTPPTLNNYTLTDPTGILFPVSQTNGGFGADVSAETGVVYFSAGTVGFDTALATSRGGWGQDMSAAHGQGFWVNGSLTVSRAIYNVMAYGAVGNGVTDDTAAIALAIANCQANGGGIVYFPAGIYKTTGLSGPSYNMYFKGAGVGATTIKSSVNNVPVFTIATGTSYAGISDMTIDRSVTAIAGGHGIQTAYTGNADVVNYVQLERLRIEDQWNGLHLGPTTWGLVRDVIVEQCYGHGVVMQNAPQLGQVQWTLDHVIAGQNAGNGFYVLGTAKTSADKNVTVGEWKNVSTFANTGIGIAVIGNANCLINGFRLGGRSLVGEDGNTEIYLDTFGQAHIIADTFVELPGTRTTGRALGTAASGVGRGIQVTANNDGPLISGCLINGCSYEGLILENALNGLVNTRPTIIGGCSITNNGLALIAGSRNGITIGAGTSAVVINGGFIGDTGQSSQQYGIAVYADCLYCHGAYFSGNTVAKINWGVAHPTSIIDAMAT